MSAPSAYFYKDKGKGGRLTLEFLTWLQEQCYQTFIEDDRWRIYFLKGLGTTFKITIGALILGVIIGIIIAVVRSAYD